MLFKRRSINRKKFKCPKGGYSFEEKHLTAIFLDIGIIMSNKVDSLDVVYAGIKRKLLEYLQRIKLGT